MALKYCQVVQVVNEFILGFLLFISIFCPLDPIKMSADEALAMVLYLGLTEVQYKKIRTNALKRNADIYPAYEHVLAAKDLATPPNVVKSPEVCVVPMQSVLDHQVVISFKHFLLLLLTHFLLG